MFKLEGGPPAKCVEPDVALCLTFEAEEIDGRALDASGQGNDALLTDVEPADREGHRAISLGLTSKVVIENVNTLNFAGPLSFEAFFRWNGTGEQFPGQSVIDSFQQWGSGISSAGVACTFAFDVGGISLPTSGGIRPNEWQHIACVYDPVVGVQLYLDGALKATDATAIGKTIKTMEGGRVRIGGFDNNTALFQGEIDDVRVVGRALTADEVLATVNAD